MATDLFWLDYFHILPGFCFRESQIPVHKTLSFQNLTASQQRLSQCSVSFLGQNADQIGVRPLRILAAVQT
jgi:hypothetical protein